MPSLVEHDEVWQKSRDAMYIVDMLLEVNGGENLHNNSVVPLLPFDGIVLQKGYTNHESFADLL